MNRNRLTIYVSLSFLLCVISSISVFAWTEQTQEYYADRLCKAIPECNGKYNDLVKSYSMYPDRWYTYPYTYKNHVNYYTGWDCPKGDWVCPEYNDQSALKATAELLQVSYKKTGSKKWKMIAMASHYFMESDEFWHKVLRENYVKCHEAMEDEFDENFKNNITNFTVCKCGICENTTKFDKINDMLIGYIKDEKFPDNYDITDDKWKLRIPRIANDWETAWDHWDQDIKLYPKAVKYIYAQNSIQEVTK